ncbi:hypothetical protein V6N11_044197 [Hibiscus sabdariffa]|uniref:Uncharacterized protein n=1 Tax=Hibiscus sabdariffa TaxID=183260 RepID=A0ABR2RER0_9ROSI
MRGFHEMLVTIDEAKEEDSVATKVFNEPSLKTDSEFVRPMILLSEEVVDVGSKNKYGEMVVQEVDKKLLKEPKIDANSYLMQKNRNITTSWSCDVGYISVAASVIYGYAIVVSLAFYFLLQYQYSNVSLHIKNFRILHAVEKFTKMTCCKEDRCRVSERIWERRQG